MHVCRLPNLTSPSNSFNCLNTEEGYYKKQSEKLIKWQMNEQKKNKIYYCTCNGFVECKGECPCDIIAVLGVFIGPVFVYIKGGGVLVGFVESIILVAILGEKMWWQN